MKLEGKFAGRHEGPCSSCFGVQILFSGWWGEPHGMSEYETNMALSFSLKLDVRDFEKGGVGTLWFPSISRRESQGLEGQGVHPLPVLHPGSPGTPWLFTSLQKS